MGRREVKAGGSTPRARGHGSELLRLERPDYERLFTDGLYALEVGRPLEPLVFHGVAGIGKTVLLERFRDICAKEEVPSAQLQLGRDVSLQQGLLQLSAGLAASGVQFPMYQRVQTFILARQGGPKPEFLAALKEMMGTIDRRLGLAAAGVGLLGALLEDVPVVGRALTKTGPVKDLIDEVAGSKRVHSTIERLGGQAEYFRLAKLDAEQLQRDLLPAFAQDLRSHVRATSPGKIALMFDTYESTWSDESGRSGGDRWLMDLREALREVPAVLLVFAGRQQLTKDWSPRPVAHLVKGFSRKDALRFLSLATAEQRAGLEIGEDVVDATLDACRESAGGDTYHCLTLDLCAGIIRSTLQQKRVFPDPTELRNLAGADIKTFVDRLVDGIGRRDVGEWFRRLAVPIRLDEDLAKRIRQEFEFETSASERQRLYALNFLQRGDEESIELYPPIRMALRSSLDPEDVNKVDKLALQHWAARGERAAAWYHRLQLDRSEALQEIRDALEEATRAANGIELAQLLTWWRAVDHLDRPPVDVDEGRDHVAYAETLMLQIGLEQRTLQLKALSQLGLAETVIDRESSPHDWAVLKELTGAVHTSLLTGLDALPHHQQAIESLRLAREVWDHLGDRNRIARNDFAQGAAHLALLEARPSDDPSEEHAAAAVAALEGALAHWTEETHREAWLDAQLNLGDAYGYLGCENLTKSRSHYETLNKRITENTEPDLWARLQVALATSHDWEAWDCLDDVDEQAAEAARERALDYFASAGRVFTRERFPWEWAKNQWNMGSAIAGFGDHRLSEAIPYYVAAQEVWTKERYPSNWQDCEDKIVEYRKAIAELQH